MIESNRAFDKGVKLAEALRAEGLPVAGVGHDDELGDSVEVAFRMRNGTIGWVILPLDDATLERVRAEYFELPHALPRVGAP